MRKWFLAILAATILCAVSLTTHRAEANMSAAGGVQTAAKTVTSIQTVACVMRRVCSRGVCATRRVCG